MPDDGVLNVEFPESLAFILEKPARYKVIYGGRGGLKSWGFSTAALVRGCRQTTRFICAREIQKTIADSVHQLLCDRIAALNMGWHYHVTDNEIKGLNGTQFLYHGLRELDAHKIKSFEGGDVLWVEEANTVRKKSWNVATPTIRKPGSEIWVGFNPELDSDETYQRFVVHPPKDSIVIKLNYADNPWPSKELDQERDDCAARYGIDSDEYKNIWLGECRSAVEGAIYAKEINKAIEDRRIRLLPVDPLLRVHTIWDLGWNDQTSIIFVQRDSSAVRVVDYIEDNHRTLADYAAELNGKKLTWGTDYLPHDGTAKNLQTGKTPQEILAQLRPSVAIVPNIDVESGIKAARLMFSRCYFDEDKTARLIECLKRYRRAINVNTQEPQAPLHDEYSHAADAFRYLGVIVDQLRNDTKLKPIPYKVQGIV